MRREARGFTLLEVLVALVIAGLALGALFSGAVTGLRSARLSLDYAEAVSRAKSHLAVAGIGAPLVAGTQHGDDGAGVYLASCRAAAGDDHSAERQRARECGGGETGFALCGQRRHRLDERWRAAPGGTHDRAHRPGTSGTAMRRHRAAGFTLLEVLVSLVVLALIILGLVPGPALRRPRLPASGRHDRPRRQP